MTLTTPVIRDTDSIFPGENWFYYWKTASSLWEERLSIAQGYSSIVIPINWGFHSETGDKFDFGSEKPEANLNKLVEIIHRLGKKPIFALTLGPAPFLINGGLPFLLAKGLSFYHNKVWMTVDGDGQLFKLFSFYEPKVFRGFQKFIATFHDFVDTNNLDVKTVGLSPYFFNHSRLVSFFDDSSESYEQAFKRYLEQHKDNPDFSVHSIDEERLRHDEFKKNIQELYLQTAKEGMGDYWDGHFDTCFLGSGPHNVINRIFGSEDELTYFKDLLRSSSFDVIPSTVLLGQEKSALLRKQSKSFIVDTLFEKKLQEVVLEEDSPLEFSTLKLFHLFITDGAKKECWEDKVTPLSLFQKSFRSTFLISELAKDKIDSLLELENHSGLHFFQSQDFSDFSFNSMIKLFLHGKKIIFDVSKLSDQFLRKLEVFYLENKLDVQKVNFRTLVKSIRLGEGQLIIYNSNDLRLLTTDAVEDFWSKLLSLFHISHPSLKSDSGIIEYWLERGPMATELNFEGIRRVTLCNVVSYKQKSQIKFPKNFLVLKVLDEENAQAVVENGKIDISFASKGSITIDFGFVGQQQQ